MTIRIPLVDLRAQYEPLKEEIHDAWDEILSGMRLFLGPNVQAFEGEFANFCDVQHAIGVNDGTNALHLALRALGIGEGDEVITVSHTFIATAEAILLAGAKPVFIDIDPTTYTMDPARIEAAITPRTKAILPVHLYGQMVDMDPILEIARGHNLATIEDACQAHGATYKGRKAGNIGDIGCFSFYFSKNLGAFGEGGMVTTNHPELADRVRMMRDHGSNVRYHHELLGWNARPDELQAAVLRIKLSHLDEWNELRRERAEEYKRLLTGSDMVLPEVLPGNEHVFHLFVVRTAERDQVRSILQEKGIGTGIHYPVPIHMQKPFLDYAPTPGNLPVTESIADEIISLPMYPELTNEQVVAVGEAMLSAINEIQLDKIDSMSN